MKRPVLEVNKKYIGINLYLFDLILVIIAVKIILALIFGETILIGKTDELMLLKSIVGALGFISMTLLFGFSYVLNGKDKIFSFRYYKKVK